jgi:Zn-finger nucleic acid-binding protein
MLCPKCHDQVLVPVERQGVEIDYCPGCRGVWLDRGELDNLIEQSATLPLKDVGEREQERRRDKDAGSRQHRRETYGREEDRGRRRNRMSSFLEDIFDFD